jgi:hypothetical protein
MFTKLLRDRIIWVGEPNNLVEKYPTYKFTFVKTPEEVTLLLENMDPKTVMFIVYDVKHNVLPYIDAARSRLFGRSDVKLTETQIVEGMKYWNDCVGKYLDTSRQVPGDIWQVVNTTPENQKSQQFKDICFAYHITDVPTDPESLIADQEDQLKSRRIAIIKRAIELNAKERHFEEEKLKRLIEEAKEYFKGNKRYDENWEGEEIFY